MVAGLLFMVGGFWRDWMPEDLQPPLLLDILGFAPWWIWIIGLLLIILIVTFEGAHRELQSRVSWLEASASLAENNWVLLEVRLHSGINDKVQAKVIDINQDDLFDVRAHRRVEKEWPLPWSGENPNRSSEEWRDISSSAVANIAHFLEDGNIELCDTRRMPWPHNFPVTFQGNSFVNMTILVLSEHSGRTQLKIELRPGSPPEVLTESMA